MRKGSEPHASTALAPAHRARTRRTDGDEAHQGAKLFVFLRNHRHEIFDEEFQKELSEIYRQSKLGRPPVPPAKLALATILQAYTGVSGDEAMEAMVMDRRWQLVLDCLDANEPPFSKYTLVGFRKALIERDLDRRLIEQTVEIARRKGGFSSGRLRGALDSSPLWGRAEWKTPTTYWDTPSRKHWA